MEKDLATFAPTSADWPTHFADSTRRNHGNAIRDLLSVIGTDVITFAGGLPAPETFAIEEVAVAADDILKRDGRAALQYGPTEGHKLLRELIAAQYRERGVAVQVENVLITSGAQQGLDLAGRIFLEPHDGVLVESPTYVGALTAWFSISPHYHAAPMDEQGMIIDGIEGYSSFKFVYSVVNFQNPTGVTLSQSRREALLNAAHRLDVAILEDDPYRELRYSGVDIPGLLELEGQMLGAGWNTKGRVIHLGTFSKTLTPGLRIGYAIAPAPVIRAMVVAKQGFDLHTSTINQMIVAELIQGGTIKRNLPSLRALYRARRDTMLAELDSRFAGRATWTKPDGGLFLWVTLPEGADTELLLKKALEHDVAFVPGVGFYASDAKPTNTFRLNFSNMPPERIQEGMKRLAAILD